jgi:hypothetical protein
MNDSNDGKLELKLVDEKKLKALIDRITNKEQK